MHHIDLLQNNNINIDCSITLYILEYYIMTNDNISYFHIYYFKVFTSDYISNLF